MEQEPVPCAFAVAGRISQLPQQPASSPYAMHGFSGGAERMQRKMADACMAGSTSLPVQRRMDAVRAKNQQFVHLMVARQGYSAYS